jgi:hypothetical protein
MGCFASTGVAFESFQRCLPETTPPCPRITACRYQAGHTTHGQVDSPRPRGARDVITAAGIADRIHRLEALVMALARLQQLH